MIRLESDCDFILTDSGGVQKEAYFFKKPCITLRDQTEWVETVDAGWNTIVGAGKEEILKAVSHVGTIPRDYPALYGDGQTGHRILALLD